MNYDHTIAARLAVAGPVLRDVPIDPSEDIEIDDVTLLRLAIDRMLTIACRSERRACA